MTTFCQTLFTMTAAATAAALAVMILRLLLKKVPRWITCALWLVVFLRMVCPVSLDLPVSLMPASITSGAAAERVIPTTITPTVPETTPAQSAPAAAEEAEPAAAAPAANPEPASPGLDRNDFLFAVWVMGVAGMVLWGAVSYLRLRRRIAEAVRLEGNLYETDQIDTPFVCGFFRPRIYLPVGLDPTDRKYVVLHEQAHIRRKDHLTKPLAYLALCLHWFNPVLWLAFRLFCRDVEGACDQAVIRDFDREKTAGYAAALLHLGRRRTLPQAVPLAFGEENAKRRVKGVLTYKKPAFWVLLAAVILCVAAGVLLLANQAPETRFEGVEISDIRFNTVPFCWSESDPTNYGWLCDVTVPEDLQRELISLLNQYPHEDYTATTLLIYRPENEGRTTALIAGLTTELSLNTSDQSTRYLLRKQEDGSMFLERIRPDGDEAVYLPDLAETPEYQSWEASLEACLITDAWDRICALSAGSAQDTEALTAILDALYIQDQSLAGPCALEVSSGTLTIRPEWDTAPETIRLQRENYLDWASRLICQLAADVDAVTWIYPNGVTWTVPDNGSEITQEDFLAHFPLTLARENAL